MKRYKVELTNEERGQLEKLIASGTATHLGRFTVSYSVEEVNLLTNAGIGEAAQFVAANGDSLFAEGSGQATEIGIPNVFNVLEHDTITGSTGRFAGASGNITTDRIVDITTGITSGTISGNIVLPQGKTLQRIAIKVGRQIGILG